jgi:hypothetical protein
MYIASTWPLWGMIVTIEAIVYLIWPLKNLEKNEYVKFFLISFSIYWLLMLALHLYLGGLHHETPITGTIFLSCFIPWVSITHLFFPFRRVKRNSQFTFFSVVFSITMILIIALAWILVQFSNM